MSKAKVEIHPAAAGGLGPIGLKNPPIDPDRSLYLDSTAGDAPVTSTWAQIKAFLKLYFDTLYAAIGLAHARLHSITSALDHSSAATPGKMLKADANGLPVDASNTDGQVAAAVAASHARQHSIIAALDHTSAATPGKILQADANGLPIDAANTNAEVTDAVAKRHTQGTDTALGAVAAKNPPIDADKAMYRDSAAADALVTSTWTQIKAFLKTYWDTLYEALGSVATHAGLTTGIHGVGTLGFKVSSKLITILRSMTAASGNVSYTGVGFKPTALIVFSCIHGVAAFSLGFQSDAGRGIILSGGVFYDSSGLIYLTTDGGATSQYVTLASFDNDGFTLTWTKTGLPTGTAYAEILCLK